MKKIIKKKKTFAISFRALRYTEGCNNKLISCFRLKDCLNLVFTRLSNIIPLSRLSRFSCSLVLISIIREE